MSLSVHSPAQNACELLRLSAGLQRAVITYTYNIGSAVLLDTQLI